MGRRCTCGGQDLCSACLDAPDEVDQRGAGFRGVAEYRTGHRRLNETCTACSSAPGGPVAREPFDWTFRWLCTGCAAGSETRTTT